MIWLNECKKPTHPRSWWESWGQSQNGKGFHQRSRSALSTESSWRFRFNWSHLFPQCFTGKSSLAWEGRPSSGKRWSVPSGHIPMGTESSLAKKSADREGKQIHMQDTIIDAMQLHIIKVTHQLTSFGLLEQYFWPILEDPFAVASGRSCQSSTPFNVIYFSEPTVNVIVVCVGNNKWLGAKGADCSRKVFGKKLFYSSRNIVQLFKGATSNYIHI